MNKKVLVTAGSTKVPIDQVRAITNIFKGATGTYIAKHFSQIGAEVTLLTSNPDIAKDVEGKVRVIKYSTYNELAALMEFEIKNGGYDVVIHSSAVSDYKCEGVYNLNEDKLSRLDSKQKVSSKHEELYLKLVPTEKLIDKIRGEWKFNGVLVKFKLEVGRSDEDLIEIATKSREFSQADFIVANCLEWSHFCAYIINAKAQVKQVSRRALPKALVRAIEKGDKQ